ncbi:MAG: efflux RND transporter permease subunit [Bacteroidales bacterium]|nr:efflux RND transporter permease subunit [Bacteroidales bacterium]MDY0142911.1 efflux RND transporter permease subunit [Bacteroidales bacterium]
MSIYKSAVQKPITTLMVFVALVIFGIFSLTKLPVDLYPELEFPAITVMTIYPGANSSEIETNVTKPIEQTLNTLDNLKEITSVSRDNMSIVTLEFEWETNLDEGANDVRNALELIKNTLPDDIDSPVIFKFNSSLMPILFYAITADQSYEGIEKIIEDKVVNRLNRIEGIGTIGLSGLPTRTIYVEVDPVRLESYGLSVEMIGGMIQAENMNLPAGNIKMGQMDYQLKVHGEFVQSEQIENIILGSFNGQHIKIKDVAYVQDSIKDMTVDEKINGETGIRMFVQKQSGANTVRIAKEVQEELIDIKKTLPPDVQIVPIMDSSEFIADSISNLTETLMYAFLFVILVVLFFLGRWRATFIIVLTIPISLIVSFIFLHLTGGSINIISLTSLSIAIGMVVDDAIVVLENITKHIERGSSPREAAIYGTNEVWLAVIVTTLVVVAVFFPLTLVSGMTGVLFRQLGWIVTITIITSTLAAISLTPMLSARLLKLRKPREGRFTYDKTIKVFLDKLDNLYEKIIRRVLNRKITTLVISLLIFTGTLSIVTLIGTEFIPEADESRVSATIELQTGLRVEETKKIARYLEDVIHEKYPETIMVSTSSGADDSGGFASLFGASGSHIIDVSIKLVDVKDRKRSCWEIGDDLRQELDKIPEVIDYKVSYGGGMGGDNNVAVEIYGYDFDVTNLIAEDISNKIKNIETARDVQISRDNEKPELELVLDRDKLAMHGLNTATVSLALRNRVSGLIASKFREDGEEYDIVVRFTEEHRSAISSIEDIVVINQQGEKIRLGDIGEVVETWLPPNIDHKKRERIVKVTSTPYNSSLGDLATEIKKIVADVEVPNGVLIDVGGTYEDQQDSFMDLGMLLALALMLVYIVMASQFESFKTPLIIMFSIPFSFSGVVLALWITGTNLSIIAALGAILLVGIVVKNAIVLVDYINLMRDRGYQLYEAIALSGKSRLRPVLMTALTTGLGMLPLALSTGEGAEIWSPMGISVIGGLVFSTVLTLIVIPVIYAIFEKSGERKKQKQAYRKDFRFME